MRPALILKNTSLLTSKREDSHRHRALAPSSRSEATGDFFEWPPSRKAGYLAAHRRLGDRNARLILEGLAMLSEGEIGVPLQVLWQPFPQSPALQRGPTGDLHRLYTPCEAPSVEPAFDGGAGDPEEFLDFLP